MHAFEQITLGGLDWVVWGRSATDVYLASVKSVITKAMIKESKASYNSVASFSGSDIDKYLNTKLVRHICRRKVPHTAIKGPLGIFDVEQYKQIRDMGFVFPPIPEERWWLQSHSDSESDQTVSNYMLQVDNNGELHKECGIYQAGVRAVLKIDKSALDESQRTQVELAAVAVDEESLYGRPDDVGREIPKVFKRVYGEGGTGNSPKYVNLHYYIAFCPESKYWENETLSSEMLETAKKWKTICNLPNATVEYMTAGKDFVYVVIEATPDISPEVIVTNLKANLFPKTLTEDRGFRSKMLRHTPEYWSSGYMISGSEIPMTVIRDYQRAQKK